jgi:hypothetical protein
VKPANNSLRANAALQAEVRERRRAEQVSRGQTQALARTLSTLTARPDLDTFLGRLFQAICEQLQAYSVGVNLHDAPRDHIVARFASVGGQLLTADDLREWGVAPWLPAAQETLWQAVLDEGCPFAIYDVPGDPAHGVPGTVPAFGRTVRARRAPAAGRPPRRLPLHRP